MNFICCDTQFDSHNIRKHLLSDHKMTRFPEGNINLKIKAKFECKKCNSFTSQMTTLMYSSSTNDLIKFNMKCKKCLNSCWPVYRLADSKLKDWCLMKLWMKNNGIKNSTGFRSVSDHQEESCEACFFKVCDNIKNLDNSKLTFILKTRNLKELYDFHVKKDKNEWFTLISNNIYEVLREEVDLDDHD